MRARQAVLVVACLGALALGTGVASGQWMDSIVAWGDNEYGQCDFVPPPNADFVAVAGGGCHSLGLKSDGTIVAWGYNRYGQCEVPDPNADFISVATGAWHSLGLKSDGTIVAWGCNGTASATSPRRTPTSWRSRGAMRTAWASSPTGRSWPGDPTPLASAMYQSQTQTS